MPILTRAEKDAQFASQMDHPIRLHACCAVSGTWRYAGRDRVRIVGGLFYGLVGTIDWIDGSGPQDVPYCVVFNNGSWPYMGWFNESELELA